MPKTPGFSLDAQLASYSSLWKRLDTRVQSAEVAVVKTIEEAIQLARTMGASGGQSQVLITGSLYLIGGALKILQPRV